MEDKKDKINQGVFFIGTDSTGRAVVGVVIASGNYNPHSDWNSFANDEPGTSRFISLATEFGLKTQAQTLVNRYGSCKEPLEE